MKGRHLLRRIDAHIERGNEIMSRNTEAFDRNTEAFERHGEAFERNREAFERNTEAYERMMRAFDRFDSTIGDQRQFMHEMLLRFDKVVQGFTESEERRWRTATRYLDDILAEQRAQRGALLAILDRLGPPGPATAG